MSTNYSVTGKLLTTQRRSQSIKSPADCVQRGGEAQRVMERDGGIAETKRERKREGRRERERARQRHGETEREMDEAEGLDCLHGEFLITDLLEPASLPMAR